MSAKKILFITQEMVPYVDDSAMSLSGRSIPQAVQENGREIRTFMPRWGIINERRNQLHEVIRLSGMNIIIDDTDHPLIIKVASIQSARMQVYFIDNDDYFHHRAMMNDADGVEYEDNAERAIFYARGVLETVKKLRWCPDVIHCHGWMSAIAPLYIRTAYKDEPPFANAKIVYSLYNEWPKLPPVNNFEECLNFRDVTPDLLRETGIDLASPAALGQLAVHFSDGIIQGEPGAGTELLDYAKSLSIPVKEYPGEENLGEMYGSFYDAIFGEGDAEGDTGE